MRFENVEISFVEPGRAKLQRIPIVEPQSGEVVVKNKYTLLSAGTEKANLLSSPNTLQEFPKNVGYSGVGEVVSIQEKDANIHVGDRVFVAYGGHKRYSTVKKKNIYKIPEGVLLEDAVFTKLASYPLFGLRRVGMEMGETVAVVGLGVLGLLGIQLAKIGGARTVIAVGHREIHLDRAVECGADLAVWSGDEGVVERIKDKCNFMGSCGVDIVIDTSGNQDELLLALEYVAKRGRISITGCNRISDKPIDIYKYIHRKGLSIIGNHELARLQNASCAGNWTTEKDYMVIMEYIRKGCLCPSIIRSGIYPATMCENIYKDLIDEKKDFPIGILFDWDF